MRTLLALLYLSLVEAPGCSSLPVNGNSLTNTIQNILYIGQITLFHIKKLRTELPAAPQMEFSTPSVDGLTSISRDLQILDNELQNPVTDLLSQIQADVSSMEGRVRFLAQTMGCPVQARPRGHPRAILFPDSHCNLALEKVQRYLDAIFLNKDKLKVC